MSEEITTPPPEPFKRGELVEVCDRNLEVVSEVEVAYAGPKVVQLVDGQRYRASDGHWIDVTGVWPWPSIRHKKGGGSEELIEYKHMTQAHYEDVLVPYVREIEKELKKTRAWISNTTVKAMMELQRMADAATKEMEASE